MTTASTRRRRRGVFGLAIAGALSLSFLAPAASAQIYGGYGGGLGLGGGYGSRGIIGGGGGYYGSGTSNIGTVQGSVASLDFETGRLTMNTAQGRFAINARPQDLVGLNPGDVASITFLNYNGARWLEPGAGGLGGYGGGFGGVGGGFAFAGEVTGTVQRVDRQRGLITVDGRTLRAHPEEVSDVYPGQFISIGYIQVGRTAWADGIGGGLYGGGIYGGGGGMYGGGLGGGYYGGGLGGGYYGGGRYGGGNFGWGGGNVGGGNLGGNVNQGGNNLETFGGDSGGGSSGGSGTSGSTGSDDAKK